MSSGGITKIIAYSMPSSVPAGQQFSWYIVGQVQNGYVTNPAVGIYYVSGPSPEIMIVASNGTVVHLSQGEGLAAYIPGTRGPGTTIDTRGVFAGAMLPVQGTYHIDLIAGWLSADEASSGVQMAGLVYGITLTNDVRNITGLGGLRVTAL